MSTVEEIVQAVKELPPDKWDEVKRRLVWLWLTLDRPDLARALDAKASPRKRSHPRRPPIKIKGKPISETVIEDRR